MPYKFFSFFFTHLSQKYSGLGVSSWVEIVQNSCTTEKQGYGFNNLLISLSQDLVGSFSDVDNLARALALQNGSLSIPSVNGSGTLELTAAKATTTLDSSFLITVDNTLTIDSTLQPINNFSLLWNTPIYEGKLHSSADYLWRENTLSLDYPYEPQAGDGQLRVLPWALTKPSLELSNTTTEQVPVWVSITVDNSIIVSTTKIKDAYNPNGVLEASRTTIYELLDLLTTDFDHTQQEAYQLQVDSLPHILQGFFLTLKKQGLVYSRTWKNWNPRGYVPASVLGDTMNGCNLEEIALAIEALIIQDDQLLLYLTVSELTFIWGKFLQNLLDTTPISFNPNTAPGYPTRLFRLFEDTPDFCFLPANRDIRQNALLGIALVDAAIYFSDRTINNYVGIPYLDAVLTQLGALVAGAVDSSGFVVTGYDDYGYPLDEYSYDGTLIASIFLNKLLTVSYSQEAHLAAARMELAIAHMGSVEQLPGYELLTFKQIANIDLAYAWWISYFTTDSVEVLCNKYQAAILQENNTYIETAWASVLFSSFKLLRALPSSYDISNWAITNNFTRYDEGLYGTTQPELVSSAAVVLIECGFTFNKPIFQLHADEAAAGVDYSFQSSQRLLPYGGYWQDKSTEDKNSGELGALLYSYASQAFSDFLLTALLKRGTSLQEAQGVVLSVLASSYGYTRLPLQSDSFVRTTAQNLVTLNTTVIKDIEEWILQTYGVSITALGPVLPSSFYTLEGTAYVLRTPASTREAFGYIKRTNQFGADISGYYERIGDSYVFTSWESIRATITLRLNSFLPQLDESLQQRKTAGIRTKLDLYLASSVSSRVKTTATL